MRLRLPGWGLLFIGLLLTTPVASAQKKEFKLPDGVELLPDVEFGKGGERSLKMHILRPRKVPDKAMPVVVWIHGGAWQQGSKDSGVLLLAPFAAQGYFCAGAEYRLSKEAVFPAQIEDCKCAIRYLRAKSKDYNLDPDRIGVWGGSAGGHLVALLGTTAHLKELEGKGGWADQSSAVQAVCDFCGPSDLIKIIGNFDTPDSVIARLLGGRVADKKELALLASPLTHVSKKSAPFLIVHGDQDTLVPVNQAEILAAALKMAGADVTLHVAKGQGHSLRGPEVLDPVRTFFERTLKSKQ